MSSMLLALVVFGSVPLILWRPYIGIIMYCWISYMNPHRLVWGFASDAPFAATLAAATLIGMVFSKDTKMVPMKPIMVVWGLWFVWMFVTTQFALEPEAAAWEWDRSMKIQLMAWLTIMLCQSRERVEGLAWILVVSIGFYGVRGGIFAILSGGQYRVWGPEGTFFGGTNSLALALMMVMPLMLYLYAHARHRLVRPALLLGIGLTIISVISSYSRGAFVTIAAVAAYLAWKSKHRLIFIPIMAVVGVGAFMFMPAKYFERIETLQTYEEDNSAMGRIYAWGVAYDVAKDRPLVGGGFSMITADLWVKYRPQDEELVRTKNKWHDTHSIYFEVLGEQGWVGLVFFMTLMWLAFAQGRRIQKRTRDRPDLRWAADLASYTQVGLVAYAVGGAFLGLAYFDLYYHLIAILVLTGILVDQEVAKTVTSEDTALSETARLSRL